MRELTPSSTGDSQGLMQHVGWALQASTTHYTRSKRLDQATQMAKAVGVLSSGPLAREVESSYVEESVLLKFI
jgi:hypothetical protein